ncbi:MAG: hypothetical protein FWC50_14980 [Planctomycetaceae bacterium]|nr:hypothetical protein [Planctomycetaceae bacterium]
MKTKRMISEQRNYLVKTVEAEIDKPDIFTTGAFLYPMKIKDSNGCDLWVWVVSDFDGDSFREGEVFNPPESAETLEELLINTTG